MADERDEIRERIRIEDLVGQVVSLRRAGKNYLGLCPFHDDKKPSFNVSPDIGRYRCFSCGESGDIFNWMMKTRNLEFREALVELAQMAGVELKGGAPKPEISKTYGAAMNAAQEFFLESFTKSKLAQDYCLARDLDLETCRKWGLGYSPDIGEALVVYLKKRGFTLAECKGLFLIEEDSHGGYYDKFKGRLMFPIRNDRGELVAFGGRIIGAGEPKYINSSDTPLYRKSRILYGLERAKDDLMRSRHAVLCEGYLDVIACHSSGVTSAVASLGTALAEEQVALLKRWADRVTILYDSDKAGVAAAEKALGLLEPAGLRVKIALMSPGDDPDTLLRRQGKEAVQAAASGGMSGFDFRVLRLEQQFDPTTEQFWEKLPALLALGPSEPEIDKHIVSYAAVHPQLKDRTLAQKALRREVKVQRQNNSGRLKEPRWNPYETPEPEAQKQSVSFSASEVIVFRALLENMLVDRIVACFAKGSAFETGLGEQTWLALSAAGLGQTKGLMAKNLVNQIADPGVQQALADSLFDLRAANLSETVVEGAIAKLMDRKSKRALGESKSQLSGDNDRQAYLERLKKHKNRETS